MSLEFHEAISEVPATPPTREVTFQVTLGGCMSSPVVLWERKILERDEEWCVETVVVFPVLEAVAVHVSRDDVDVEVGH